MIAAGEWPEEPGLRFLIRQSLRRKDLCPDAEECPGAWFECRKCGHAWRQAADDCPRCGAGWKEIEVEHGAGCPQAALLEAAMDSRRGALIQRAEAVRRALEMGFTVTLDEVTAEEFAVMAMIAEEAGRATAK